MILCIYMYIFYVYKTVATSTRKSFPMTLSSGSEILLVFTNRVLATTYEIANVTVYSILGNLEDYASKTQRGMWASCY